MSSPIPVKFLYAVVDERAGRRVDALPLLSVSKIRGVVKRDEIDEREPRADDLANYKIARQNDIVINRMSAYQGALGLSPVDGLVSPDYLVIRPHAAVDPRFLALLFRSSWFIGEMTARLRGIGTTSQGNVRTPRINEHDLGRIATVIPSEDTQRSVADYLDRETAQIDALIRTKDLLVKRFEERRASLLLRAVFPPAIPGDWIQTKLKFLFEPPRTGTWGNEPMAGGRDILCVRVADFDRRRLLVSANASTLRSVESADVKHRGLQRGDVLVEKSGGGEAQPVGFAVCFDLPTEAVCSNFIACLRPVDGINPRYAALAMAAAYRAGLNVPNVKQTTGIQNLDLPAYLATSLMMPPEAEQVAIAESLSCEFAYLDRLEELATEQVALLRERRQALITAAVTGQLDIPEAA